MAIPTLADVRTLDAADPIRSFRDAFDLPDGIIYLDGNSLGPLPRAAATRMTGVIRDEWGSSLIRSWNDHDWIAAPQRIGAKIAAIVGAKPTEIVVADSTSVNVFKLIMAVTQVTDRSEILTEAGNFPTDLHIARRAAELCGKRLRVVETADIAGAIGPDTAVIILSHVHYRNGHRHDMAALTNLAHTHGAKIIWDLSHSAGAIDVDLNRDGVELAIGCTYKYLNGGPGSPAYLYVVEILQDGLISPIAGWMGHATPFAFEDDYVPAGGISRFLAGTPPVLSLLAMEPGIDMMLEADRPALFEKSRQLFDLFAALVAAQCPDLSLVCPHDPQRRGSHISFAHPDAFAIIQALIARGVIGDFRAPDVARFGLTPLYMGFEEIWNAVAILADVMDSGAWRDPRFAARGRVT